MATQTIERNKELKEASMATLVAPSQNKTRTGCPEPLSPTEAVQRLIQVIGDLEEEKEIAARAEMVTYAPAPIHRDGLLVSVARPIVAFYDWLSGPPMSDRDRLRSAIAEERYDRYLSF